MQCPRLSAVAVLALVLAGCTGDGVRVGPEMTYNPSGTGPFDSRGNYVEAWADNPRKWRGRSVPTPPSGRRAATPASKPLLAAVEKKPVPTPLPAPAPAPAATQPVVTSSPPAPAARPPAARPPAVASNRASSPPKPKPKPKAKPAPIKPKKPAPVRVTVKKGDTLYALARRNKTTVTAIKRANGLKSDLIKPGQRLLVPRY